jgi:hypothetical protein
MQDLADDIVSMERKFPMYRTCIIFASIFLLFVSLPGVVSGDYLYPDSAVLQPLAVMEPAAPDSLFHTWTGDLERGGLQNLGLSLDFLRNAENSNDWDVIFAATGSFRSGERLLLGITAPYIIRDSDFNESDLLDLRLFARMRLLGKTPSFRVSGELSAILPTADKGNLYPFTLDSPVVGARLAFAGGSAAMRAGATVGYQNYLASESGTDTDLLYGVWMEKNLEGPWSMVGEVHGSKHTHSGAPGNDEVSDNYFQVGVRRAQSERVDLGLAAGTGIGGDTAADLRITATAIVRFGTAKGEVREKKKVRKEPEKMKEVGRKPGKKVAIRKSSAKPYTGIVVIMIAEGVADSKTEKRITKALQQRGYATGMDPDPDVKIPRRNVLLYNPGMQEKAITVSRSLVMGGYLKDLRIEERRKPISQNWLLLLLGGER